MNIVKAAAGVGIKEIALGDTIGVATPWTVRRRIEAVRKLRRTMVDLNPVEAMETLVAALKKHKTNDELLSKLL